MIKRAMKIRETLNYIRGGLYAIPLYKNWREVIISFILGDVVTTVTLRSGIRISGPDNTVLQSVPIFGWKVYNPHKLHIEPDDIVVDIGANIGVFTLFAACKTRNKIYAYEPFPENFEILNRNIQANNITNVVTMKAAATDEIGSAKLLINESSDGHRLINHSIEGELQKYIQVPTVTLQSIIDDNNLEHIDFLKIDCEGSEGSILTSTPKQYLKRIRKIAMEFHDNVSPLKHDDIQRLLEDIGFVVKLNWDGKSPFGYLYGRRD